MLDSNHRLRKPTARTIAIFDLDGTITARDTYRAFLLGYLRRHPRRWLRCVPLAVSALLFALRLIDETRMKRAALRAVAAGVSRSKIEAWAETFVRRCTKEMLRPAALAQIEEHRRAGHRLVLATASPDIYVRRLARELGFDHVVCTKAAWTSDGVISGELNGVNLKGDRKFAAIRRMISPFHARGSFVVAYSDHRSDLPLLRWADRGVVVNPDARLAALAGGEAMTIETWGDGHARPARGSKGLAQRLVAEADRLGRNRFALLFLLLAASSAWLACGLASSWWWHPPGLVNDGGRAIGRDFAAVWSAASMALAHDPAGPYDQAVLHAAERAAIGAPVLLVPWFYPPIFLMLAMPLAALPYLVALVLWLSVPFLALVRLLRQIARHPLAPVAALIFPGTAQCLISGQNGVISALLVAGGLVNLEARPILAGLFFGVLSYKPQLAAAGFAALLFGGHWRSLAAASAAALALALASVAAFGIGPWIAFLGSLGEARRILETGAVPWDRMVTFFAAARLAGATVSTAYALQSAVAAAVLAILWHLWRQRAPLALRGSALVLAIPLTTPYGYYYDLVVLLLPILWLLQAGLATGFRRGEVALLVLGWASPVAGWLFAKWSHLLLTPAILLLLLGAVLRRAAESPAVPLPALRRARRRGPATPCGSGS